jgi:hypothetical protein
MKYKKICILAIGDFLQVIELPPAAQAILFLFVLALREIGAARTGTYSSTAPFIGAFIGLLILWEPWNGTLIASGLLMAFGVWLHLTEQTGAGPDVQSMMVHAAATASFAVLEVLVHLDLPPELIPDAYRLLTLDVPDDIAVETLERTPESEADCRAVGDRFLDRGEALGLRVPSAIVSQEHNILLNPRHVGMERVRLQADDPFRFDPRLLDRTR